MRENFTGVPTTGISPSRGCTTRSMIRRAAVCGSSITRSTVFTGVAGTPASSRIFSNGSRSCFAIACSSSVSRFLRWSTRSLIVRKRRSIDLESRPDAVDAWPRATKGRDRAVDEPGVDGRKRLVAEAERLHRPRAEVLDQDVAPADEGRQHLDPLGRLEIERDVALVAVDDEVRRGLALLVGRPRS